MSCVELPEWCFEGREGETEGEREGEGEGECEEGGSQRKRRREILKEVSWHYDSLYLLFKFSFWLLRMLHLQ